MPHRHFVTICNNAEVFNKRYGIGSGSKLGILLHKTLVEILESNQVKGDESWVEIAPVCIASWKEKDADGGETTYEVNEGTAAAFWDFNKSFAKEISIYKEGHQAIGGSLLIQQCKSDIIGTASNQ